MPDHPTTEPTNSSHNQAQHPTTRSRKRRNVVGNSPHRDEYIRLMEAGWSGESLERYARWRYGEDIPSRTFRAYRSRRKVQAQAAENPLARYSREQALDVIQERATLIALQKSRLAIDVQHEVSMSKLFSSTRLEVVALNELLQSHKEDLQDLGLMPKVGETLKVESSSPSPQEVPQSMSLSEALGVQAGDEAELAKVLHMATRSERAG